MPRKKKPEIGRPARPLPPRIDATAEEIVSAVLNIKPKGKFFDKPVTTDYHCGKCGRPVNYPEILYRDGFCYACHTGAPDGAV